MRRCAFDVALDGDDIRRRFGSARPHDTAGAVERLDVVAELAGLSEARARDLSAVTTGHFLQVGFLPIRGARSLKANLHLRGSDVLGHLDEDGKRRADGLLFDRRVGQVAVARIGRAATAISRRRCIAAAAAGRALLRLVEDLLHVGSLQVFVEGHFGVEGERVAKRVARVFLLPQTAQENDAEVALDLRFDSRRAAMVATGVDGVAQLLFRLGELGGHVVVGHRFALQSQRRSVLRFRSDGLRDEKKGKEGRGEEENGSQAGLTHGKPSRGRGMRIDGGPPARG